MNLKPYLVLSLFPAFLFVTWGCVTSRETGKTSVIMTSEAQEAQLGAQAFTEVLQKQPVSHNARWNAILQRVGDRVAAAANKPSFRWEFKLLESKEKNAFCLPGGKVAFYTGIYPVAVNEAGLAAIMGHEVAHATERHAGQRLTLAFGTEAGIEILSAILGSKGSSEKKQMILAALGVGAMVGVMLPFSRENESDADAVGLTYMARAGYDPREAPKLWGRMAASEGGRPPVFLSTHPASDERRKALESQIPKVWGDYEASAKVGTGENLQ